MDQFSKEFGQAQRLGAAGAYEDALAVYDKLVDTTPGFAAAWAYRGKALQALDRFDEAIESIRTAIDKEPDRYVWYTMLAGAECVLGRYEEAGEAASAALELEPSNILAKSYAAMAKAGLGEWDAATDDLLSGMVPCQPDFQANAFIVVERELDRREADGNASYTVEPSKSRVACIPVLRSIMATYYLRRAERAADKDSFDDALEFALRAYELTPHRFGIDEFVTEVFLVAGDAENAGIWLKKAEEKRPDDPVVLYLRGRIEMAHRRPDKAMKAFVRSIDLDPELEDTYYWMGRARLALGEPQRAVGSFVQFALRDARHLRHRFELLRERIREDTCGADNAT